MTDNWRRVSAVVPPGTGSIAALRARLARAGLTQRNLSEAAGVDDSYISRVMNGIDPLTAKVEEAADRLIEGRLDELSRMERSRASAAIAPLDRAALGLIEARQTNAYHWAEEGARERPTMAEILRSRGQHFAGDDDPERLKAEELAEVIRQDEAETVRRRADILAEAGITSEAQLVAAQGAGEGLRETTFPFDLGAGLAEGGAEAPVTLLKAGLSRSTSFYPAEVVRDLVASGRFTGAPGRVDHPDLEEMRARRARGDSLKQLALRTGDAFFDETAKAAKAPIHFLAAEVAGSPGALAASLMADPVLRRRAGISVHYDGRVKVRKPTVSEGGSRVVLGLLDDDAVLYCDIVFGPASAGPFEA